MSFERDGFQLIHRCLTETECDEICRQLGDVQSAGTRNLLTQGWCQMLANDLRSRLSDTIPRLEELTAIQCTYFNKSSAVNWQVPFHQDRSIPVICIDANLNRSEISMKEGRPYIQGDEQLLNSLIACRIHLDPSTDENGPLRVIPGSHKLGILDDDQISTARHRTQEATVTAPQGSALLLSPLLVHASAKSTSDRPRRVLHFLFVPAAIANHS